MGKVKKDEKTDPGEVRFSVWNIHFDISYNQGRVVEIDVLTDPNLFLDISEENEIETILCSVKWKGAEIPFE